MAVTFKNASIVSALTLAFASLTLPAVAEAQDNGNRSGWRAGREDGGGSRGGGEGRRSEGGGWQQRAQAPAPQSAPNPGWSQRSAPAPQATVPQAPSRAAWGRDGGNRGNWENRGNRGNSEGRGEGGGRGEWRGGQANPAPAPVEVRRGGNWSGDATNHGGRTDRRQDGWNGRDGRGGTATRGWTGSDRWRGGDRDRDGVRDGDRHRDGSVYRDGQRYRDGDRNRWRSGDRHHYGDNHHRWDRRWRDNHRYNWHTYRTRYPSYYRIGYYHAPYSHYRYRRLSIGFFLDSLFYSQRYWISDPWQYRLPDAYGPYRWVRYYDDALLVDIYSGEVVDVIHDFFW